MKITILAHHPFPIAAPYAGGLEMQTHVLAKGLQKLGHEVTLYAHPSSDPSLNIIPYKFDQVRFDDIAHIPIHKDFNEDFIRAHHGYLSALKEIAQSDADIVHFNCLHHTPFIMHRLINKPKIASLHTLPIPFLQSAILTTKNDQDIHYTAVSARMVEIWEKYCGSSEVVYNGIDINQWAITTDEVDHYVVWAGRICPEKGTKEAVLAAQKANVPIRIAGPVCDSNYFENSVRPLLTAEDEYVGHLDPEEMCRLISGSEGFIFTSLWEEPFGMVLIEALACGAPVIAYNSGAVPEILTDKVGVVVDKGDVEDMARAIKRLPEFKRIDCRNHIAERFTAEVMVEQYLEIYKSKINRALSNVA